MTIMRRTLATALPLFAVLLAMPLAMPLAAQEEVGTVYHARGQVSGTPPGGSPADLSSGDRVVVEHEIRTGDDSRTGMLFDPEGRLRIEENTRLTIDRATVDAVTGRGQSALTLWIGKIELALGSLFRGEVTIDTPSASLGIKGTVLRVLVDADGRTLVAVLEGVVEVSSKPPGPERTVVLPAGTFTIVEPGGAPSPPAPFDPGAGTLSPDAGGPDFTVPGEDVFDETPLIDDGQRELPRNPEGFFLIDPQQEPPPGDPNGP
jgi:hypothetical protein